MSTFELILTNQQRSWSINNALQCIDYKWGMSIWNWLFVCIKLILNELSIIEQSTKVLINQCNGYEGRLIRAMEAWMNNYQEPMLLPGEEIVIFSSHFFIFFLICISQMFLVRICWIYFSWPTSDLSCLRSNFWCRRGQELGHAGCDFWICICEATMPPLWSLSFLVWVVFLYWLFVFVKQHCLQTEFFVGADLL